MAPHPDLSRASSHLQQASHGEQPQPSSKNQVLISHGRAPWYGPDGRNVEAYVVGIAGGSASGKTSVARAILSALDYIPTVLILSQDAFYYAHTPEQLELAFNNDLDLDHPDAIDKPLFAQCLSDLKQGKATEIPVYSFVHHQRMPEKKYIYGASVIIVEGIMALQSPELRSLYDLKVFVNCDSDLMLARRIRRDVKERGRDVDGILDQYLRFVKDSYDNFVQPSSRYADIIVPGSSNQIAIELLVTHVKRQLESRSLRFRKVLAHIGEDGASTHETDRLDKQLTLLAQTNQLLGIMTILRDRTTSREEFIFHIDRLSTIIVEKALALIPCTPKTIKTPQQNVYPGVAQTKNLVGISILRSGLPFSQGLRRVVRDIPIGGILIQSDPKTGEPLLLKSDLPHCVKSKETSGDVKCLLLDSLMGTGAAAVMAIRILLDHGVIASNIIFLTYLISRPASYAVLRAFPDVQIVTAAIDPKLDEMRIPVHPGSLVLGEAAGEGDFAVRWADDEKEGEEKERVDPKEVLKTDSEVGAEHFRVRANKEMEEYKFSRGRSVGKHGRSDSLPAEKRAWVISPGKYVLVFADTADLV
ncbi:uridine kinase [Cryptococcus wingfieldii CBS 7118]|uniref:Uridine kinase n=1 Tax=Cryptococcus wingfieldii CBS 7118 TaxID=1295528 RepID=A0A1E3I9W3_9TREE|nr:uridine kinase [Cryptococcus wingfieldii CBS 7118]ODN85473.1 uridine kinase [Cryptococcus wingfieldii CBS 7118]